MELTLQNHPAQARHWKTKKPLFEKDGTPTPLFPDQKAIHFDGYCIAYVSQGEDGANIGFVAPLDRLPPETESECRKLVDPLFGGKSNVSAPPTLPKKTKKGE